MVIRPVEPALHQRPKTLYPVGACLPLHVFPSAVFNGPVGAVRHPLLGRGLVGVDHGTVLGGLQDEPL